MVVYITCVFWSVYIDAYIGVYRSEASTVSRRLENSMAIDATEWL